MPTMLITGCAGFIGNAACRWYRDRYTIIGFDNLSRATAIVPPGVDFHQLDAGSVASLNLERVEVVLHLAAQVSVLRSFEDPWQDFKDNAVDSLAVALWAKEHGVRCLIYSSTNKVYGELVGCDTPIRDDQALDPRTPYGVSKACGGLYIRDLLPDASYDFRQSCIYGEHQIGTEDQGWIGYLRRQITAGEPITCYGDGLQVRDVLHVSDLLRVYDLAIDRQIRPGPYTVGGGVENAVTFRQAVKLMGGTIDVYAPWRPSDQRYFVSANSGLPMWRPKIDAREWLRKNRVEISVCA